VFGCILGGVLSDRIGRCLTTAGMMAVSGVCALLIGFTFDGPSWLLALVAIIWGISVIGDSAQFSAAVTELADQRFVGTAVTLQLGFGFALTVVAISIMPHVADWMGGWQWVFVVLVPGPAIGATAMLMLRRLPEAAALAGGRR
jgi:MFS family permease